MGAGCSDYKQTRGATSSIWDVRVTTNPKEVGDCRLIEGVDSRDSARGCGLTVQPTPEECLRYQVRRAGGDTLLLKGPVGDAYHCSGRATNPQEAGRATPPTTAPPPTSTPQPPAPKTPTPPSERFAEPRPASRVPITQDRESARGCVYLGDAASKAECTDEQGEASGDCADQALRAGGDLILLDGARAQIFSCKAKP
jgi:hypothetical protein